MSRFCKCKSYSHFFSKNFSTYTIFNDQSYNDTLTNDIVSFEELGPDILLMMFWNICYSWLLNDANYIWSNNIPEENLQISFSFIFCLFFGFNVLKILICVWQIETNKNTALTLACFQGRHEVVSLLVDRRAIIEHRAKVYDMIAWFTLNLNDIKAMNFYLT